MKKILAITLALIMLLSVVSCRQTNDDNTTTTTTTTTTTNNDNNNETPDDEGEEGDVVADLSSALAETFAATLQANPEATVEELINIISTDPAIPEELGLVSAPIENGTEFFFGFGNYTITGFESSALCMPMISSIAFITYVFELPADADAEAFAEQLKSNFDYRWVICDVAADPVVKIVDNMVFFASCPAPDEMPEE